MLIVPSSKNTVLNSNFVTFYTIRPRDGKFYLVASILGSIHEMTLGEYETSELAMNELARLTESIINGEELYNSK